MFPIFTQCHTHHLGKDFRKNLFAVLTMTAPSYSEVGAKPEGGQSLPREQKRMGGDVNLTLARFPPKGSLSLKGSIA